MQEYPNTGIWLNGGVYSPISLVDDDEFNALSILWVTRTAEIVNLTVTLQYGIAALHTLRFWTCRAFVPPLGSGPIDFLLAS